MKKAEKLHQFRTAKQLAFSLPRNCYKRVRGSDGQPGNYCGWKIFDGTTYVVADSLEDMQNPDCWVDGKPARKVSDDFTVMKK